MSNIFLRNSSELSSIKRDDGSSITILTPELHEFTNNREYLNRCLSNIDKGKKEFVNKLTEIRRVIFNKEELIRWLYKIMEDCKEETELIFIRHGATIGRYDDNIEFEEVGLLAGIYAEAKKYLDLMTAIDPINKNIGHYSILDRLEELDEKFIDTNDIPGYYYVQKDIKIKKHKYQLKNLDQFWIDYLSFKDKHKVSEGFGDIRYFLQNFHNEFKWQLIKIRPRAKIKDFLDYQLNHYSGEPIDFINNIEYRIMSDLATYANGDYLIYEIIIKEWLKNKKSLLNQKEQNFLLDSVISASSLFLDNVFEYRKSSDENKYNIIIRDLLIQGVKHKGWYVKDESMGGTTDSKSKSNKAGISFRDLIVINEKQHHISALECLRIKSVPKTTDYESQIMLHLKKIFRNEPIGLSPLFIIVYCETQSFSDTWGKYADYISRIDFENYENIRFEKEVNITPKRANLKVARVTHLRETSEIEVYHLFVNMNP